MTICHPSYLHSYIASGFFIVVHSIVSHSIVNKEITLTQSHKCVIIDVPNNIIVITGPQNMSVEKLLHCLWSMKVCAV